jgi:hypothetical protein
MVAMNSVEECVPNVMLFSLFLPVADRQTLCPSFPPSFSDALRLSYAKWITVFSKHFESSPQFNLPLCARNPKANKTADDDNHGQ